jgi:diadenosine tetraphosphatase ApaH/serine/threonine PP2A family protein phosphatase
MRSSIASASLRPMPSSAATGIDDGSQFNHVARAAAFWTGAQLTPDNAKYLRELPMGPVEIDSGTEICHGAPFDEDHYIFDGNDAHLAFESATHALCLFGHTHLPAVYRLVEDVMYGGAPEGDEMVVPLQRGARYLINVGSIGQPRDGDPRAGYGVLDDEAREVTLFRVPYAVDKAQSKILAAGLPASLANRLEFGR